MRVASVQIDVVHGEPAANIANALGHLERLAVLGVDLAVFPECALTGYGADDLAEARRIALGRSPEQSWEDELAPIQNACVRLGICAVVGYLLNEGSQVFNGATFFDHSKGWFHYRKTHLPFMGADRFCTQGEELEVLSTSVGQIGLLICYDLRFPEATRALALQGAELLCLPTNWPTGAVVSAEHISIARAAENRIFVATCNRVGSEKGFDFIGRSKIVGVDGQVLACAGGGEETIIADIELADARQKRRIVVAGTYETDVSARRTDLYRLEG